MRDDEAFLRVGFGQQSCAYNPAVVVAQGFPADVAEKNGTIRLRPSSPWHLEMADDRCRLARKFCAENTPSIVSFEQIAPGQRFDLTVAGPDVFGLSRSAWTYAGMRSDQEMSPVNPLYGELKDFGMALNLAGVSISQPPEKGGESKSELIHPSIDLADASQVERIVIRQANSRVSFETGNMKLAFEALNACAKDLIPTWGLSLEGHESYKPPTMPDGEVFYSRLNHRFAKTLGADGHEAHLRIRALVGADGSVSDCHFEYPLSTGSLLTDVCEDIRKIRFISAKDRKGAPMASFFVKSVILRSYSPWTADAHGGRWSED